MITDAATTSGKTLQTLFANIGANGLFIDSDAILQTTNLVPDDANNIGLIPCSTWDIASNGNQTMQNISPYVTQLNVLPHASVNPGGYTVPSGQILALQTLSTLNLLGDLTINGKLSVDRTAGINMNGHRINMGNGSIFQSNFQYFNDFPNFNSCFNIPSSNLVALSTTDVFSDEAADLGAIRNFSIWQILSTVDHSAQWPDAPGQTASSLTTASSISCCSICLSFFNNW